MFFIILYYIKEVEHIILTRLQVIYIIILFAIGAFMFLRWDESACLTDLWESGALIKNVGNASWSDH